MVNNDVGRFWPRSQKAWLVIECNGVLNSLPFFTDSSLHQYFFLSALQSLNFTTHVPGDCARDISPLLFYRWAQMQSLIKRLMFIHDFPAVKRRTDSLGADRARPLRLHHQSSWMNNTKHNWCTWAAVAHPDTHQLSLVLLNRMDRFSYFSICPSRVELILANITPVCACRRMCERVCVCPRVCVVQCVCLFENPLSTPRN